MRCFLSGIVYIYGLCFVDTSIQIMTFPKREKERTNKQTLFAVVQG